MFTPYGYINVIVVAIISITLFVISYFLENFYLKIGISSITLLFLLFTLYFFRDPERTSPKLDNVIVSPADGKVLLIKKVESNKYVNGEAWQVSIFMSPLNVHVNRIPIDGKVELVNYVKGEYLVAFHDKADERNERSEFGILSKFGKVFFTQVAGFVARRIVYYLNEGDNVTMGKRFGMIKFGSRVDVIVSTDWDIKVKENDIVSAGESILFEYNK
ncbi:MAG: phosphatidylserine decarboxylase family protein [Bacteroidetes bacterium]|nr:phosphatidylserine decarboxylase family protein [Bacteroidota bacterium]MBU1114494.1 phosphatidylserine decarboxylase family protein [Bacteroidota bacterium]MBU1799906.1 phosphatidylserine decarboxylase family protein [Bacteroidota bacterium]